MALRLFGFELNAHGNFKSVELMVEAETIREAIVEAERQNPGYRVSRGRALDMDPEYKWIVDKFYADALDG